MEKILCMFFKGVAAYWNRIVRLSIVKSSKVAIAAEGGVSAQGWKPGKYSAFDSHYIPGEVAYVLGTVVFLSVKWTCKLMSSSRY